MNEIICVLIIIGFLIAGIPIVCLVYKMPDIIHGFIETIKWNMSRWDNDLYD